MGNRKKRSAILRKDETKDIVSATLRNFRGSPRKMRLLADVIRSKDVTHALNILKIDPRPNSIALRKLLLSAINNWAQKHPDDKMVLENLYIEKITVDPGPMLKRIRPAPQGRAYRIRKRSNHVTIVLNKLQPIDNNQDTVNIAANSKE
ncbi:MAG: 50S ribosomal protein L22 [Bacteroidia bacterium]|nr:50S ribosomal protein L22 [Bacteroidia bacterium]MDW8159600.1 50S ribosomal protein L22 [Bacteroidia bacterium]